MPQAQGDASAAATLTKLITRLGGPPSKVGKGAAKHIGECQEVGSLQSRRFQGFEIERVADCNAIPPPLTAIEAMEYRQLKKEKTHFPEKSLLEAFREYRKTCQWQHDEIDRLKTVDTLRRQEQELYRAQARVAAPGPLNAVQVIPRPDAPAEKRSPAEAGTLRGPVQINGGEYDKCRGTIIQGPKFQIKFKTKRTGLGILIRCFSSMTSKTMWFEPKQFEKVVGRRRLGNKPPSPGSTATAGVANGTSLSPLEGTVLCLAMLVLGVLVGTILKRRRKPHRASYRFYTSCERV